MFPDAFSRTSHISCAHNCQAVVVNTSERYTRWTLLSQALQVHGHGRSLCEAAKQPSPVPADSVLGVGTRGRLLRGQRGARQPVAGAGCSSGSVELTGDFDPHHAAGAHPANPLPCRSILMPISTISDRWSTTALISSFTGSQSRCALWHCSPSFRGAAIFVGVQAPDAASLGAGGRAPRGAGLLSRRRR